MPDETERRSYEDYHRLLDRMFDISEQNVKNVAANTSTVAQVLEIQKESRPVLAQLSSDHRAIVEEVKTVGRFVKKTHWIVGIILTVCGLAVGILSFASKGGP